MRSIKDYSQKKISKTSSDMLNSSWKGGGGSLNSPGIRLQPRRKAGEQVPKWNMLNYSKISNGSTTEDFPVVESGCFKNGEFRKAGDKGG